MITRRQALGNALALSAGMVAAAKINLPAIAQDAERHGMSAFGDLKYPADFPHFSYVNPKAPKGGVFSQIGPNNTISRSRLSIH